MRIKAPRLLLPMLNLRVKIIFFLVKVLKKYVPMYGYNLFKVSNRIAANYVAIFHAPEPKLN